MKTADINPHYDYKVKRQIKRGKVTGLWYVQFYRPAPAHCGFWRVGSAKGEFASRAEAEAWVNALRRMS